MSEKIPVGNINLETGELLDAALALVYPKRKNGFGTGWVAVSQSSHTELAKRDLGNQTRRVLDALIGLLDYDNLIAIHHAELAKALNMPRPNISRAIARLKHERILLSAPRENGRATYRLNPTFAWKGSAKTHHEALRENMKARGISIIEGG